MSPPQQYLRRMAMSTTGDTAGPCRYWGCFLGSYPCPPSQTSVQTGGTADDQCLLLNHTCPPPPGEHYGATHIFLVKSAPTHSLGPDFPETHATHLCPQKGEVGLEVHESGGEPTGKTMVLKEPPQEETDLRQNVCDRTSRCSPGPSPGQVLARLRRPLLSQ